MIHQIDPENIGIELLREKYLSKSDWQMRHISLHECNWNARSNKVSNYIKLSITKIYSDARSLKTFIYLMFIKFHALIIYFYLHSCN